MKTIQLLLACMLFTHGVFAQVTTEKSIEFEEIEGYDGFSIEPFGKNGLLVYSKSEEGNSYRIQRYNTDLEPEEKKDITLPKGYFMIGEYLDDESINFLFSNKKGQFIFYQVNGNTFDLSKASGIFPKKTLPGFFVAKGNFAYITRSNKKGVTIIQLNISTGKSKIIPLNISPYTLKDLTVEKIQPIEETGETFIYVNAYNKKDHNLFVMQVNESGTVTNTFNLSKDTEKKLSSVSASPIGENEYVFTGTYSSRSSATSEGMYICSATNGKVNFMKFYNFVDFTEFFSYLPERTQEKIEKKKAKADDKGKEFSYNYYIAEHPIRKIGDNYLLVGEAYYPTYRQEAYTSYVNGKPVTNYRTVFDGYQYTHATIAMFDSEGGKLWDQTFKMYPGTKPFTVKRFISETYNDDELKMVFASLNSIKSMSVGYDGKISNERSAEIIKVGNDDEKVKSAYSNIEYWYGNTFVAYGNQLLKNSKESIGNKKRRVYYINKIVFE
ncbi:MAG TPA: hypothetical protein PKK72_08480 [Chitinophagales bacterium]|nr:hypothetical protein [Chitinophagales bacterium]